MQVAQPEQAVLPLVRVAKPRRWREPVALQQRAQGMVKADTKPVRLTLALVALAKAMLVEMERVNQTPS